MFAFAISLRGTKASLSVAAAATPPYDASPLADTPACTRCLETVGPLMSTAAVYHAGSIDFAYGVGVPNYTKGSAGIFWGQLQPSFSGAAIASAKLGTHGTLSLTGADAFLPSVMSDAAGTFYILFDGSGPKLDPSVYVAARRPTDPPGAMHSITLIKRGAGVPPTSWYTYKWFPYGDYTAASYDPSTGVWVSSQYARSSSTYGDYIANVRL